MNLIKQIFRNANLEHLDYTTIHTMEIRIYALANAYEDTEEPEREDLEQLLIEAGNFGQEAGFNIGFRYAVMLLSECYS